jgi:hypothetical protein
MGLINPIFGFQMEKGQLNKAPLSLPRRASKGGRGPAGPALTCLASKTRMAFIKLNKFKMILPSFAG